MHVCFSAAELSGKETGSQLTSATDLSADVELFTVTQLWDSFEPASNDE